MLWILLACTVGSTEPADPNSTSGSEAAKMEQFAQNAGRLANRSRELESIAKEALERIDAGGDRQAEIVKIEAAMKEIEAINSQLQVEHDDLIMRISEAAQSTATIRE